MNEVNRFILLILMSLIIASCGPGPEDPTATGNAAATTTQLATSAATPEPMPDPEIGERIFNTKFLETSGNSCHDCHKLNDDIDAPGVELIGIATRAEERVEGMGAQEYLRQSILDPRAYLVEGYDPERMPTVFGEILSEADIDHLIAYLMTLE